MDGILLIDKASGPTSFDVVRAVRRRVKMRRVGHAGTLDPLASGLLIVCLGQGTKLVPYLMDGDKRYRVTVTLGQETDTLDSEGDVVRESPVPSIDRETVMAAARQFVGRIDQVPPLYSALKKGGEALYVKARRGEQVHLEPRAVRIDTIDVLQVAARQFSLMVQCGKGTYIRSLARDVAVELGTVGYVSALRREATSGFDVSDAQPFAALSDDAWEPTTHLVSMTEALPAMPRLVLNDRDAFCAKNGQLLTAPGQLDAQNGAPGRYVALLDDGGRLLAIAQWLDAQRLKPVRGFPVS